MTLDRLCQAAQRAGPPMKSARSYEPIVKAVLEELANVTPEMAMDGGTVLKFYGRKLETSWTAEKVFTTMLKAIVDPA